MSVRETWVVFDLFGTLIFQDIPLRAVAPDLSKVYAEKFGVSAKDAKNFLVPLLAQGWLGRDLRIDVDAWINENSPKFGVDPQQSREFLWENLGPERLRMRVPARVGEVLHELTTLQLANVAVISNSILPRSIMLEMCKVLDIYPYVTEYLFSSEGHGGKPDPHMIEKCLSRHAWRRDRTIVVGDSPQTDIAMATVAGVSALLVNGEQHWEEISTGLILEGME